MSTRARRRLIRDFKKLQEDPPAGVSGTPSDDNILLWHAVIFGPHDTPFEDGTFRLVLQFTEEYPNKPPSVKFTSKMFHPNVYADGSICLDILQNRWSPTYDVSAILTSIQSLLDEPNPNSPANNIAAQLFQENRREYERKVQAIVEQSWISDGTVVDVSDEDSVECDCNSLLGTHDPSCPYYKPPSRASPTSEVSASSAAGPSTGAAQASPATGDGASLPSTSGLSLRVAQASISPTQDTLRSMVSTVEQDYRVQPLFATRADPPHIGAWYAGPVPRSEHASPGDVTAPSEAANADSVDLVHNELLD